VALVHLGPPRQERQPPERAAPEELVVYLD
jgi:hypothetical protein